MQIEIHKSKTLTEDILSTKSYYAFKSLKRVTDSGSKIFIF